MELGFLLALVALYVIALPLGLIVLFSRTASLRQELLELRLRVSELIGKGLKSETQKQAPETFTESRMAAATASDEATVRAESPEIVVPEQADSAEDKPVDPWQTQPFTSNTLFDKLVDRAITGVKRYFTEGNLIVRVGVIILFVGIAFLLKYAADHSMLPAEYRLIGAAALGIGLLVLGWRLRFKRTGYALVLQGGGIGVLYLTLFTAFRVFQLLPAGWVFACLLVMVVLSALLAVLQDSRSLAVLAISGGFMAPILTSTGAGSHIALFTYYTILNIGILTIAWFKSWRLLNLIGFVFTFVIGTAWGLTQYKSSQFLSTEIFLIIFFLFYVVIALLFARRQPPQLKGYVDGTMVFGVPIVAFSLQAALVYEYQYGLAISAFGLGFFYIGLAWLHWLRGGQQLRLLSEAFLALGVVFATLTIPFALDGEWIATAWALEGAAIVWISIRQQKRLGTAFALALQLFAGFGFLAENTGRFADWPILNSVFMGATFVALAGLLSGYFLYRNYSGQNRWEARLIVPALLWGLMWWFANGLIEIDQYVPAQLRLTAMLAFVAGSCAVLGVLETKLSWSNLKHTVTGFTGALLLLLWITLLDKNHPFADLAYLSWAFLFIVFYGLLWQRDKMASNPIKTIPGIHAIGLWSITVLLAVELHWQTITRFDLAGAWSAVTSAVIVWLVVTGVLRFRFWPVATHLKTYLSWGLVPLVVYLLLWSIFANPTFDGRMNPLPYIPIVNPLDIMQLLVLFTIYNWWREYRQFDQDKLSTMQMMSILAVVVFVWINAVLLRSLHHWYDVAYTLEAMWNSLLVQACISVFWTLLGLAVMVVASRKHWRTVWIAAAGLLGMVVAKLLLIDLAEREALETIVSFILVGLLLLVVGYFSPLPPKKQLV